MKQEDKKQGYITEMGPAVLMNFYGRHPLFFTQTTEDLKKPRCTANNDS